MKAHTQRHSGRTLTHKESHAYILVLTATGTHRNHNSHTSSRCVLADPHRDSDRHIDGCTGTYLWPPNPTRCRPACAFSQALIATHRHRTYRQRLSRAHTPTQGLSAHTGLFNPTVVGRAWHAHTIPLASQLTIHSLVIGSNLIPHLPSQLQSPQSRQQSKCPTMEAARQSPLPTLVSPSTFVVEMGFTN